MTTPTVAQQAVINACKAKMTSQIESNVPSDCRLIFIDHVETGVLYMMEHVGSGQVQVALIYNPYVNRAGNIQMSSQEKVFGSDEVDTALTLYEDVKRYHGGLAFGVEIRNSRGSGIRIVR